MDLQRINVKLFVDAPDPVPVDALLPVFARWREDTANPAEWVDLADYAHVPRGPGVMIIGRQGNLALDLADPGPGILYANKKALAGSVSERVLDTFRRALALTRALLEEPGFPSGIVPRPAAWELVFNDRIHAPNTDATHAVLGPDVDAALDRLFGAGCAAVREPDAHRRYGFIIHGDGVDSLDQIAARV